MKNEQTKTNKTVLKDEICFQYSHTFFFLPVCFLFVSLLVSTDFRLALLLDYPILPFIPRWFTESFLYLLGEYTYEKANHFLALSSSYMYSQCPTFYSYSLNNPTVVSPVYLVPIFLLLFFFNYLQCILRILNIYGVPYIYLWCCNLLISWRGFVDYCARKRRFRKLFSKILFSLDKW